MGKNGAGVRVVRGETLISSDIENRRANEGKGNLNSRLEKIKVATDSNLLAVGTALVWTGRPRYHTTY